MMQLKKKKKTRKTKKSECSFEKISDFAKNLLFLSFFFNLVFKVFFSAESMSSLALLFLSLVNRNFLNEKLE